MDRSSGRVVRAYTEGRAMRYDPVTTFVIYIVGMLVIITLAAIIADLWLAHDERMQRRQARDESRAKLKNGEGSFASWQR